MPTPRNPAFNDAFTEPEPVVVTIDIFPEHLGEECDHMDFAASAGPRCADYLEIKLYNEPKEQGINSDVHIYYVANPTGPARNNVDGSVWITETTRDIVDATLNDAWRDFRACQTVSDWDALYETEINKALSIDEQYSIDQATP